MTMTEAPPAPVEVGSTPDSPVLVARRPFNWYGRNYTKGEVLDPQPTGRKREVLGRAGFVVADMGAVATVRTITEDGKLACPVCSKSLNTVSGLKTHMGRMHKEAR